ncbi:MAG: DUF4493 domain-containing protein [Bacteroides sp.]|nr:DUF4493 domain-containing protein [Bacteroides sp.]
MNISKFNISLCAGALLLGGMALSGCVADEPFGSAGEGTLRMKMVINSDITRAEFDDDTEAALRSNCVVYISDPAKGLLHKYKGLENLPESINMKNGSYVAEAWTGDSVTASFDKKFFRGYQPFEISGGVNQVVINCKIANVVASVNSATIDPSLVKDMKINIGNTRGSLDFDESNYDFAKGYFMMPNGDTSLSYTVSGVNSEGKAFSKSGVIENVERAHEYVLNFAYNPDFEELGGSFITINIDDSEIIVEDEVEILSRPSVSLVEGDIDRQVVGSAGGFKDDIIVKVAAFGGVKKLSISSPQASVLGLPMGDGNEADLMNLMPSAQEAFDNTGISWDVTYNEQRNLATCFLVFPMAFLNSVPEASEEYVINLAATDNYGKTTEKTIRLAVGEGAVVVEDPVLIPELADWAKQNLRNVKSTSALIPVTIQDDAVNPGIRYRVAGSSDAWTEFSLASAADAPRKVLRKAPVQKTVTLTGLKSATRYEVQSYADGFVSTSQYITTESVFIIPNSSMEQWGTTSEVTSGVVFPGEGSTRSFWDTGNHGAKIASAVLTDKSADMFHLGSYSARLESKKAAVFGIGKLAAGNLFAGTYVKTDGTDGVLKFGREYDGSHPDALKVWVNYRPQTVQSGNNNGYVSGINNVGDLDKGQIYVALTTEQVEIRTKSSNRALFDPNADCIVAYGERTFDGDFGPDGSLQELTIPIEYRGKAANTKPLFLVIVCSASKFGDYYAGGIGSLMYVDDFELIYE